MIKKELEQQPDVTETGLIYKEEEEKVPTIYDKYARYIEQANSGYLVGLSYNNKLEILQYCEEKIGAKMPMNLNCGVCVIDLIKLFVRLKDK